VLQTAVLVPFQKNAFAVGGYGMLRNYKRFLDSLMPAQVRAISHLIFLTAIIDICNRRLLARTKDVITLQYVLLNFGRHLRISPWWLNFGRGRFEEANLESLVELPQLRNVSIEPRMVLNPELSATHVMEGFLALSEMRE
jgi:hypothetical protein